jgi:hypothetical protein
MIFFPDCSTVIKRAVKLVVSSPRLVVGTPRFVAHTSRCSKEHLAATASVQ